MLDLNRSPYFDDYDESKKFHRVLYRPTYAVQARELTQQQTILQEQIARFGNHIFKNGSMVIPGQITFDPGMHYVKLQSTYGGFEVAEESFVGRKITGVTSGVTAEVILSSDLEGTDPKTLYIKYLDAGSSNNETFLADEVIQTVDSPVIQCKSATTLPTGLAAASSIQAGIYFLNGYFIIVDNQTLILSKYSNNPSTRVGLTLYETLVTESDDSSLADNAQGSYNYAAPGAHRYKLDLLLESISLTGNLTDDFIELQRIENGVVINEIRNSEYNELEKNLARRTFDESGNYTVSPFNIDIREHLKVPDNVRYANGKYLAGDTPAGDATKIAIGIEPGKAYVRGFERVKLATTWIENDKARTFGNISNSVTNFGIGQYIYVTNVFSMPDISSCDEITLWDTAGGTAGAVGTGNIGSARIRAIQLVDKDTGDSSASVYRLYLFDINLNAGEVWENVVWVSSTDSTLITPFTAACEIATGDYADYAQIIHDPTKKASIFKLPHSYIKTLKPAAFGGVSDTTYTVQRMFTNESVDTDNFTITAGSGNVFDSYDGTNYILMNLSEAAAGDPFIEMDSIAGEGTETVTITLPSGGGEDYTDGVRVLAPIIKTVVNAKSKTLSTASSETVTSPNQIQGSVDYLKHADGYELISVFASSAPAVDIKERYTFDNGQKDAYYDRCSLKLKSGYPAPASTDTLSVTYTYFSHSNGDYCSVDSYRTFIDNASYGYESVPAYYSESGQYDLTDCFDFRPVINQAGDAFTGLGAVIGQIPEPRSNLRCDYEHYLNRIDKLYIDYTGAFGIVKGTPAIVPEPPKSPNDGMVLFEIFMTAYGFSPADAKVKVIENKRYTMRDIGSLEKRIYNLEYYTSLSLLEKETAQMQIQDALTGNDRFKNGFIVEPFNSHLIGDSINANYHCSIDPVNEIMRPEFSASSVQLEWSSADSNNTVKTGPLVTLPFTNTSFISQLKASTTENVNPFSVRTFEGNVTFQPDSDNWYDTQKNGDLVVNDDAHYEALQFIAQNGKGLQGVQWNSWQNLWSSTSRSTTTQNSLQIDRTRNHDTEKQVRSVSTSITSTTTKTGQKRTGTRTTATSTTVNKDIGDRTIGINYIPIMRSIPVLVKVDSMKPNTRVYPFFDDISVVDYCVPAIKLTISNKTGNFITAVGKEETITTVGGGSATVIFESDTELYIVNWNEIEFDTGDTITGSDSGATADLDADAVLTTTADPHYTDDKGRIGMVFTIPNDDTLKFRTGERAFILSDQVNNTEANQTKAKGLFKSAGSLLQQEGTVLSTKTIRFNQEPLEQFRTIRSTSTTSSTSTGRWFDPLAQTFLVEEEGGCFLTQVDIYFRNKDASLPLTFQIREVVNGYPGQIIVPYSEVTVYPEDINVSETASTATTIQMQAPVFLQQGAEYCFVLLTDSFEYNVWVGEIGQLDIVNNELISKQPYNGVLFKSQNASTWTANQSQDLMFTLYKAVFEIETSLGSGVPIDATNIFYNAELPLVSLGSSPLETFVSSNTVRVHHPSHGFQIGSQVTLSGIYDDGSGFVNGITIADIEGTNTIVTVEKDSYTINAPTTTANDSTRIGGDNILSTTNVPMDLIRPNIAELIVPGTNSTWEFKSTYIYGTSHNQFDLTDYDGINITENNYPSDERVVLSTDNETTFIAGAKSLELQNYFASDNRNLSPVIDLNRLAVIAVSNKIDNPTTATYTGTGKLSTTNGSPTVEIDHPDHGLATGADVELTAAGAIGGISQASLTGVFTITRIDDDTYSVETDTDATSTVTTGNITVVYGTNNYKYTSEVYNDGTTLAKYFTRPITVEDVAISARIMFTAVIMDDAYVDVYIKTQGPYDTTSFSDLTWTKLTTPDFFVPVSENIEDYKDYEFTVDNLEFTTIAVKLVMRTDNTAVVPIFDNLRVICLGV